MKGLIHHDKEINRNNVVIRSRYKLHLHENFTIIQKTSCDINYANEWIERLTEAWNAKRKKKYFYVTNPYRIWPKAEAQHHGIREPRLAIWGSMSSTPCNFSQQKLWYNSTVSAQMRIWPKPKFTKAENLHIANILNKNTDSTNFKFGRKD